MFFINFQISGPDHRRSTAGKGRTYQDVLNMLIMLLPGAVTSYYGDEIGMEEIVLKYDEVVDYASRNAGPVRWSTFIRFNIFDIRVCSVKLYLHLYFFHKRNSDLYFVWLLCFS